MQIRYFEREAETETHRERQRENAVTGLLFQDIRDPARTKVRQRESAAK